MATQPIETIDTRPDCPECGQKMGKASKPWCGRHRKQLWRCANCGRTRLLPLNGDGHSSNPIPSLSIKSKTPFKEVTMPRAGGEDSFKDKPLHICPVALKPDNNPQGCAFHNSGLCDRLTYPFGCRLNLTKEDWEKLPVANATSNASS